MKKIISLVLLLTAGAGILFSARVVDRMAVAYLSGQRRVVGEGSWGEKLPDDGPVPGYLFLGFTRPSENPKGMTIRRPREMARELGLAPGDVVTEVDGKSFSSSQDLMSHLVRTTQAGQRLSLTAVTPGEEARELTVTLRAFVRNPGDLDLPYENVEIRSDSGYLLQGWLIPPPERSDGRLGIFVHGAKASRFQALEGGAKHWYRRGYGLLMMDLSGRGASEGVYITYTMNERHDVTSMLRWARHHPKINPQRLVVFGTSNGAAAAIYAASLDALLPALAVDAPYGDLWDAAGSMLRFPRRLLCSALPSFACCASEGGRRHEERPALRRHHGRRGAGPVRPWRCGQAGASHALRDDARGAALSRTAERALGASRR